MRCDAFFICYPCWHFCLHLHLRLQMTMSDIAMVAGHMLIRWQGKSTYCTQDTRTWLWSIATQSFSWLSWLAWHSRVFLIKTMQSQVSMCFYIYIYIWVYLFMCYCTISLNFLLKGLIGRSMTILPLTSMHIHKWCDNNICSLSLPLSGCVLKHNLWSVC